MSSRWPARSPRRHDNFAPSTGSTIINAEPRPSAGIPLNLAVVGVSGIVLVVLTGLVIRFGWHNRPTPADSWWHDLLASQPRGIADAAAQFLHTFGGTLSMTLVTATVVALLLLLRRRREAITIGLTVALASGICTVLKILLARPRPLDGTVDVGSDSFPSGHTTTAAALTVAIALAFPRVWTWVLAGAWVLGMALSRTYLLVHWASDVLAAAILGASMALLVAATLSRVFGDSPPRMRFLKKPSIAGHGFTGKPQASTDSLLS